MKAKIVSIRKRLWGVWWTTTVRLEDGRDIVVRTLTNPFCPDDSEELAIYWLANRVRDRIVLKKKRVSDRARIKKAIGEEIEVEV